MASPSTVAYYRLLNRCKITRKQAEDRVIGLHLFGGPHSGIKLTSALQYHFVPQSLSPVDFVVINHYNETNRRVHVQRSSLLTFCKANAIWAETFLCTQLLPDGSRRTLVASGARPSWMFQGLPQDGRRRAKLYTKNGILGEETDVEWLEFDTQAIRKVLERDFGFRLDAH
jgi:hypothetical protein